MAQIVISTNITLDGVVEDPDGQEGSARGGWFGEFGGEDLAEWARLSHEEALAAEAVLLGRGSDEWFGSRWTGRSGERADRLDALPKYVVASEPHRPRWSHVNVLGGDLVEEVARLKEEVAGDVLVYASRRLVGTLLEHDLVDELRLTVFPVVLGAGERLFGATSGVRPLRLTGTRVVGGGLVLLTYRVVRPSR